MFPSENVRTAQEFPILALNNREALYKYLLSRQMGRILRLVDLEVEGEVVETEFFDFGSPSRLEPPEPVTQRNRSTHYEAIFSYTRNDARLELINNGLERALGQGQFTRSGKILGVDGFRLRNLPQWANYPFSSLDHNIGSISSYCNCDCEFCYEKGTRQAGISLGKAQLSLRELETRIRYYSVESKKGLLSSSRFSLEPFTNPYCMQILERMHEAAPEEFINLTTNGSFLNEDIIGKLSRLRPIILMVSMNAGTVEVRTRTMRDRKTGGDEIAFASLPVLRKYEIPFMASYVPWPSKPLSDMEDMVRFVDENDGFMVRICMPSWTNSSAREAPFDTQLYWKQILKVVERLRQEVSVPIHLMPNMYQLQTIRPVIQGTIKNSPAAEAGMKYRDLIVAIDGEPVYSRPEAANWLATRFETQGVAAKHFTIIRDGKQLEISISGSRDQADLKYPYRWATMPGFPRRWVNASGILLADGFQLGSFMQLKEIVEEYAGKRVLFYISDLAEPHFSEGMTLLGEAAGFVDCCEFHVEKLWPRYWGGNVVIGDLWTFHDLIEQTRTWIERNRIRPDVVIVPWTFLSRGGRDLVENCPLDFEQALDIEFRPLPCSQIAM